MGRARDGLWIFSYLALWVVVDISQFPNFGLDCNSSTIQESKCNFPGQNQRHGKKEQERCITPGPDINSKRSMECKCKCNLGVIFKGVIWSCRWLISVSHRRISPLFRLLAFISVLSGREEGGRGGGLVSIILGGKRPLFLGRCGRVLYFMGKWKANKNSECWPPQPRSCSSKRTLFGTMWKMSRIFREIFCGHFP